MDSKAVANTSPVALEARRTEVTETLAHSFAHDEIGMEEFERRLAVVDEAKNVTALEELVADLPSVAARNHKPASRAPEAAATLPGLSAQESALVAPSTEVRALFGSTSRRGIWRVAKKMDVAAVFGSVEIDFREAALDRGLMEIAVSCWFGSIEITVPPDVNVIVETSARLGSVDDKHEPVQGGMPKATLRVRGAVTFGSLEIRTRLPGESNMGATIRRAKDAILGPSRRR